MRSGIWARYLKQECCVLKSLKLIVLVSFLEKSVVSWGIP